MKTDSLSAWATGTPFATPTQSNLPVGLQISESETQSMIESLSISLQESEIVSFSEVTSVTFSFSLTLINSMSTYFALEVVAVSQMKFLTLTMANIPVVVYVPTKSRVAVAIRMQTLSEEPATVGSAFLIAIVSGAAVVAIIVIGIFVFLMRTRRRGSSGSGLTESSEPLTTTVVIEDVTITGSDSGARPSYHPENDADLDEINQHYTMEDDGMESDAVGALSDGVYL
jgi:hypothetical protein